MNLCQLTLWTKGHSISLFLRCVVFSKNELIHGINNPVKKHHVF